MKKLGVIVLFCLFFGLGCSSPPVKKTTPVKDTSIEALNQSQNMKDLQKDKVDEDNDDDYK